MDIIEAVEKNGLDAMSCGVALGWATEAYQKGLVSTAETIIPFEFGLTENYIIAVRHIAGAVNDFYTALGRGCYHAASVYGGRDFALTFAKNEMAGYHTGYGSVVGSVVGARHSHLCNGGYAIDQSQKKLSSREMVDALLKEEKERCMLNSLIICLFARKVYDRQTILKALNSIGYELTDEDLTAIADRIYKTKLRIKKKMGFDQMSVRIPKRFFQTASLSGLLDEATAYEMIEMYNKKVEEFLAGDEVKSESKN